jgi:hypothetical protein
MSLSSPTGLRHRRYCCMKATARPARPGTVRWQTSCPGPPDASAAPWRASAAGRRCRGDRLGAAARKFACCGSPHDASMSQRCCRVAPQRNASSLLSDHRADAGTRAILATARMLRYGARSRHRRSFAWWYESAGAWPCHHHGGLCHTRLAGLGAVPHRDHAGAAGTRRTAPCCSMMSPPPTWRGATANSPIMSAAAIIGATGHRPALGGRLSHRRQGVRGQNRRSDGAVGTDRQTEAAVQVAARRHGGRRRAVAVLAVRSPRHARDHQPGLPRRTARRLPQPAAGRRAPASAANCWRPTRWIWHASGRGCSGHATHCVGQQRSARRSVPYSANARWPNTSTPRSLMTHSALPETTPPLPPKPRSTASDVVRTNLTAAPSDAAVTVRAYKSLAAVERAFRSMKTVDLELRPALHWTAPRVRAHGQVQVLAGSLPQGCHQARRSRNDASVAIASTSCSPSQATVTRRAGTAVGNRQVIARQSASMAVDPTDRTRGRRLAQVHRMPTSRPLALTPASIRPPSRSPASSRAARRLRQPAARLDPGCARRRCRRWPGHPVIADRPPLMHRSSAITGGARTCHSNPCYVGLDGRWSRPQSAFLMMRDRWFGGASVPRSRAPVTATFLLRPR